MKKTNLLAIVALSAPVISFADVPGLVQQITQGLNGIETAIYSIGAIGVAISIAFVAVRLVKRGARAAG